MSKHTQIALYSLVLWFICLFVWHHLTNPPMPYRMVVIWADIEAVIFVITSELLCWAAPSFNYPKCGLCTRKPPHVCGSNGPCNGYPVIARDEIEYLQRNGLL